MRLQRRYAEGALGVISVTANVAARAMHEVSAAALRWDHDEAAAIDGRVAALHRALFVDPTQSRSSGPCIAWD